jgi:hypothetical protein
VSEKICRARSAEDPRTAEKKGPKRSEPRSRAEVATLLGRIFAELKQTGNIDLEAAEMGFRSSC